MKTSAAGRTAIMEREGVRLRAYRDIRGLLTIGVGHAAGEPKVTPGMTITMAEADAILAHDLDQFEAAVSAAVQRPLTQHQFDACVSLAFNIGAHAFSTSMVVRRINAGDMAGAANAFLNWDRPRQLLARRQAEREQFLTPDVAAA